MQSISLYEAMALRCLASKKMNATDLVAFLQDKFDVSLSPAAKFASVRRLRSLGLVEEVKDPSTRGKTCALTHAGKEYLDKIIVFWREF